jgi:hypothetical protein
MFEKLHKVTKNMHSYSLIVETYIFQARLALLNLNLDGAQELLTQAQLFAEEKGLCTLGQKTSSVQDTLVRQVSKWYSLIE